MRQIRQTFPTLRAEDPRSPFPGNMASVAVQNELQIHNQVVYCMTLGMLPGGKFMVVGASSGPVVDCRLTGAVLLENMCP